MKIFSFLVMFFIALSPIKNAEANNKSNKEQEERIVKSLMTIKGFYKHITPAYIKKLIKESREVISMKGNEWLTPEILIGLAMNESDLRWWVKTGGYGRWDCGIAQIHTPFYSKTIKGRKKFCSLLIHSTKLSFIYMAKVLNILRNNWCLKRYKWTKKHYPKRWKNLYNRCIFNCYNQGPGFLRKKSCYKRYKNKGYSKKKYRRKVNMCLYINKYWFRSLCFIRGLELGRGPKISCRKAQSLLWINKVYKR